MTDIMDLTLYQTRIIGVLIEKEITTPDQYPLSLNALTNGCNQKSNREPILSLDEATTQETVDELIDKRLVTATSGFGSRVTKYQHRFCNTEFSALKFNPQELAIICVLFLRGPQTPGELRTRTSRLCKFDDMLQVELTLQQLIKHGSGPFVVKLPREPGRRESRYAHLFSGEVELQPAVAAEAVVPGEPPVSNSERLMAVEKRMDEMQTEIEELKEIINELLT